MNEKRFRFCSRLLRGLALGFFFLSMVFAGSGPGAAHLENAQVHSVLVTIEAPPYQYLPGGPEGGRLVWTGEESAPVLVRYVALPPDAAPDSVRVRVIRADLRPLPGLSQPPPAPQMAPFGSPAGRPALNDGDAPLVSLLSTGQVRRWRYADLRFVPLVRSADGTLLIAERVDVELTFNTRAAPQLSPEGPDLNFDAIAQERFANYEQAKRWYPDQGLLGAGPEGFTIVTSRRIVAGSQKLPAFIDHLERAGYAVEVVTESDYGSLAGQAPDGTAEKIRRWLQDNYISRQIKWVLFIGNPSPAGQGSLGGDVPMKLVWPRFHQATYRETATDAFYADLTGNWDLDGDGYYGEFEGDQGPGGVDFGLELIVGRIAVYNYRGWEAELDRVLEKIIRYEEATDTGWRKTALLAMAFTEPDGDNAVLSQAMQQDYLSGAGITADTLYQHKREGCNSVYQSTRDLTEGAVKEMWQSQPYGLVSWAAHGSPVRVDIGFSGDCADGLLWEYGDYNNLDDRYPAFVFAASCAGGDPGWTENLGVSALKRGGGVAAYAAGGIVWGYTRNWKPDRSEADLLTFNYYVMKRVVSGETAGEALAHERSLMSTALDYNWANIMGINLYGSPSTRLVPREPSPQPPAPPTGLQLAPVSASQINLAWTDASDNETGFQVERSPGGAGQWQQIAQTSPGVSNYADTNLPCAASFDYRVRAVNEAGESAYTTIKSAATLPCPLQPPDSPGSLQAVALSSSQVQLTWADRSSNEEGFQVERSPDGSAWEEIASVPAGAQAYLDAGLTASTTFWYRVLAFNAAGSSVYTAPASTATEPHRQFIPFAVDSP